MKKLDVYRELFEHERERALADYFTLLRFPSISSESRHKSDLVACASWLQGRVETLGFNTTLWPSKTGHPILFASHLGAGPEKPTVLIYNHYDVQPADPLELWETPPFDPVIKGGAIYGRGAQDNKGQCSFVLEALNLLLKAGGGTLPLNVKLCIEGDEECGSAGLPEVLSAHRSELKADYLVVVDVGIPDAETPAIVLGARGIVTMEVTAQGASVDLHSGSHGGIVYNPIHALVEVLAQLRNSDGSIAVPGFYDAVLPPEEGGLFDEHAYRKTFGAEATGGERAFSPTVRSSLRPTLEINGISGGYSGDGFKTVIPALAKAKVSCRLVTDQDPKKIGSSVKAYIESLAPPGINLNVTLHPGGGRAVRADANTPIAKAIAAAYSEVFSKQCLRTFEGGSIPIMSELVDACGGELVMMGLGLASDNIHAPNEHFDLARFEKGVFVIARALEILGSA